MEKEPIDCDTAITLALLHGCGFYQFLSFYWYAREAPVDYRDRATDVHEVEEWHASWDSQGRYFWPTREALAHDYCRFYGLGGYEAQRGHYGPRHHKHIASAN